MSSSNPAGRALDHYIYTDGGYLEKNPLWHIDESPFKVRQILRMLEKNYLHPSRICEVGCGAREVLRLLHGRLNSGCRFTGYEISPQAFEMCRSRANATLQFKLADISQEEDAFFDLMLILDVVEHVEDYFGFLKRIRPKSDLKLFHFPLDLSVQAVIRKRGLLKRRENFGHIQYFTKETALQTLKDVSYEVLDYFFTPRCIELGDELTENRQAASKDLFRDSSRSHCSHFGRIQLARFSEMRMMATTFARTATGDRLRMGFQILEAFY